MGIPDGFDWTSLTSRREAELEAHYAMLLRKLGEQKGMLCQIFTKAQSKITDPAKQFCLIDIVDGTKWVTLGADVKGDFYEGLLERNAEDTKSGAGQYFTLRALIRAMVESVRPEPSKTIADPACGTGGFFLAAHDFLTGSDNHALDKDQKAFLKLPDGRTFFGGRVSFRRWRPVLQQSRSAPVVIGAFACEHSDLACGLYSGIIALGRY